MQVLKLNGESEPYNVEKIHTVVTRACEGFSGVSVSDIEMNAGLSIFDGIETDNIQSVLVRSANDLISESNPNYQYVAARLLSAQLRKKVWGSGKTPPNFVTFIMQGVETGRYDSELESKFTEKEIGELGKYIKHNRDDLFSYAGLQQLSDK
jgi:ribonucleoside-diphosphate reductase alpha chain